MFKEEMKNHFFCCLEFVILGGNSMAGDHTGSMGAERPDKDEVNLRARNALNWLRLWSSRGLFCKP